MTADSSRPNQPFIASEKVQEVYQEHAAALERFLIGVLKDERFTHFGDPDYYEHNGTGYLVVPLTGGYDKNPAVAFFKTGEVTLPTPPIQVATEAAESNGTENLEPHPPTILTIENLSSRSSCRQRVLRAGWLFGICA